MVNQKKNQPEEERVPYGTAIYNKKALCEDRISSVISFTNDPQGRKYGYQTLLGDFLYRNDFDIINVSGNVHQLLSGDL